MPLRRFLWLPMVAALAGGAVSRGQQPANPPPTQAPGQQPTFRTGTNLVRVDVAVTDAQGRPVTDLTAGDFEVLEDGVPLEIATFAFLERTGEAKDDDMSLEIRSPEHARAEAARDEVRLFVIFLDDYHIDFRRSTLIVREAFTEFITRHIRPTDLLAIANPLTPLSALRFTRNRYDLLEAIRTFEGRRGSPKPPRSVIEEAQLFSRDVRRVRIEVTLSALHAIVTHLGSLREGRKSVIFVSEGFGLPMDLLQNLNDVHRAANEANTGIYTVDPRGLTVQSLASMQDVLWTLASNTGGETIANVNAIVPAMQQVLRDSSALYLLGVAPAAGAAGSAEGLDGRFHELKVRVKRRGLTVKARRGYWAPSEKAVADARARAAIEPSKEILDALAAFAAPREGHLGRTWLGVDRGVAPGMRVSLIWEAAESRAVGSPHQIRVAASTETSEVFAGFGDAGNQANAWSHRVPSSSVSFSAGPGSLRVRLDVLDAQDRVLDSQTITVAIPDLWGRSVALSTPSVIRARNSAEAQAIAGDPHARPTPAREFHRSDRLLVRVAVYASDPEKVTVAAKLLTRLGATLTTLRVEPSAAGDATHHVDLPLSSLAPGEYVLRIEAGAGDEAAAQLVAFRVRP